MDEERQDLEFPAGGGERASQSLPTITSGGMQALSADMPEEWGGRPTGTTRRAIRMQKAWDERQAAILQQQEAQRRQYEFDRAAEIQMRNQAMTESRYDREMEEYKAKQKMDAQKEFERQGFMGRFNELDPQSSDFSEKLVELYRLYPLSATLPEVNAVVNEYKTANTVYREAEKENSRDQKQEQDWRVQQEAMATELGISVDEFTDPRTGEVNRIGLMQRVGEERRKQKEDNEKKAQELKLDAEKRSAVTSLNREIRDIDDELDSAEALARSAKGSVKKEAMQTVDILNKRRARRQEELQLIYGETETAQPELPTKAEVDAARTFIRNNPDSPQVEQMRAIIERFEGGEGQQQPAPRGTDTQPPATQAPPAQAAAQPATSPPFLAQEEFEAIPETRREFATGEMAQNLDTIEQLNTELDRLYRVRFTSKENMEKYKALEKQLNARRKEDTKLRTARRKEIREEMKKLGPYSSGEERKKYIALQRELQLLTGV